MIQEDLVSFFSPADFAVQANLNGGPPIYVHFDHGHVEALGVESSGPVATCQTADVEDAEHGSTLTIDGTDYTVRGIEPDGTGVTVLRLHLS